MSESSRIGRKSAFSKELSELREPLNDVKQGVLPSKEVTSGIVLDIVGSYKQTSIFIDEKYTGYQNFKEGIYFIVGLFGHKQIAVVAWKRSEDELRHLHGTDRNIIGRECSIVSKKLTGESLLKGEIIFNNSLDSNIKSYNQSEYMSISFFANSGTNYLDQLKGVSKTSGLGEVWKEVKPR
jgi:hypothetical protein